MTAPTDQQPPMLSADGMWAWTGSHWVPTVPPMPQQAPPSVDTFRQAGTVLGDPYKRSSAKVKLIVGIGVLALGVGVGSVLILGGNGSPSAASSADPAAAPSPTAPSSAFPDDCFPESSGQVCGTADATLAHLTLNQYSVDLNHYYATYSRFPEDTSYLANDGGTDNLPANAPNVNIAWSDDQAAVFCIETTGNDGRSYFYNSADKGSDVSSGSCPQAPSTTDTTTPTTDDGAGLDQSGDTDTGGQSVTVPDVVGEGYCDAETDLEAAGLTVRPEGSTDCSDTVQAQLPVSGGTVSQGFQVLVDAEP